MSFPKDLASRIPSENYGSAGHVEHSWSLATPRYIESLGEELVSRFIKLHDLNEIFHNF